MASFLTNIKSYRVFVVICLKRELFSLGMCQILIIGLFSSFFILCGNMVAYGIIIESDQQEIFQLEPVIRFGFAGGQGTTAYFLDPSNPDERVSAVMGNEQSTGNWVSTSWNYLADGFNAGLVEENGESFQAFMQLPKYLITKYQTAFNRQILCMIVFLPILG